MKGWKFALIPALLLGGSLLSGCGNQGNQGNQNNQNPPLTNEEVQALVAPLLMYASPSMERVLQSMGYVLPTYTPQATYTPQENQPCPYGGYVTQRITASPNNSYTEVTFSGSAVMNHCRVAPELTYESGTSHFWGSVQPQGNFVQFYVKEEVTVTAIFRGQNYSIQGNLEGSVQIPTTTPTSGIVPLQGTLYINGKPYLFKWP